MVPSTLNSQSQSLAYLNYWKRKELLNTQPQFPTKRWWADSAFSEIEQLIFDRVKDQSSLLDVGAGDLRVQQKYYQAGFQGIYHTQDIGQEFAYTYSTLAEIDRHYGAVLCFDTLEHLDLQTGLVFLHQLIERVAPGGLLVLQTPNARCVSHPLTWDMTHLHCYNIQDLWSYLTALGLRTEGYRVVFQPRQRSLRQTCLDWVSRAVVTRCLGLDYASNIVLLAQKP